jgi:1,4-dihydroxy-2-naphthoyl-CoA hydrolase
MEKIRMPTTLTLAALQERSPPFSRLLQVKFTAASANEVRGELLVRPELCTIPEILHGGAMMAFADKLGAVGAVLNLREGPRTTTLESKTNFIACVPLGQIATGVSTPLHVNRRTIVWQTRIRRSRASPLRRIHAPPRHSRIHVHHVRPAAFAHPCTSLAQTALSQQSSRRRRWCWSECSHRSFFPLSVGERVGVRGASGARGRDRMAELRQGTRISPHQVG